MLDRKWTLPDNWQWAALKEIAEINPKLPISNIDDELPVSFIPMKAVAEVSGQYSLLETRNYKQVKKGYTPFINGDVIFAKITPCMENGKSAVLDNLLNGIGYGSTEFHVARSTGAFIPYFLFYYITQKSLRLYAQKQMSGSAGQMRVTTKAFSEFIIPLPPLLEQRRIVAKIEELFSELNKGVELLKTLQGQLKVYRQAVLKSAFEGRLTAEWRKNESDNYGSTNCDCISKFNDMPIRKIPRYWKWVEVSNSSSHIIDCLHSTPKFTEHGCYCIDTTCIQDCSIQFDKIRYVSEETFNERNIRLIPSAGDILFAREGTVGTSLIVPPQTPICLGQRMMLFRPKTQIRSKYLMYYFQSPLFKAQYQPLIGGTTSPHLNIRDIKRLLVPLCSIPEQDMIVKEIESRLSIIDKLHDSIKVSLIKAESLRQSILKKAFEGRLLSESELEEVRNEPDWEPASVLLEKIKAHKAAADTSKPPAKKSARKGKKQA